jgi:hypothetical protein
MTTLRRLLLLALLMGLPVLALADPAAEDENRQQVDKIRTADPAVQARLRHNLAVFRQLPPERQEAIRKLYRDLLEEKEWMRSRLEGVMERYGDWLEKLPTEERQSIATAPDKKTRLERIRAIREKQWVSRLPKYQTDGIAKTPEKDRPDLIRKLWQADQEDRADWQVMVRSWDGIVRNTLPQPSRFDQLPDDTREYFDKNVKPLLSREEEKQLKDTEGRWPRYPRMVVELADAHPLSLQGPIGTVHTRDLNPFIQKALEKDKGLRDRLKEAEGKWPEFAVVLRESGKGMSKKGMMPLPPKMMPARPRELPDIVREFIDKKLVNALDDQDQLRLKQAEGNWPDYPRTVLELARKHNLQVPTWPSRLDSWDRYRWRSPAAHNSATQ